MLEIQGGPTATIARRSCSPFDVSVGTSESSCDEIPTKNFVGGSVEIPSGSSITSLQLYASHTKGGTHVALYDTDNATITLTVAAGRVYSLPSQVFDIPYLKLVANASGTVSVFLKG